MQTATITHEPRITGSEPAASVWRVDPAHSSAQISVDTRIMLLVKLTVNGHFSEVSGLITLDERDLTRSRAQISVAAESLDTANARRDKHLKSPDFLDVVRYPRLTFTSGNVEPIDAASGHYRATGDLTVHGVTRPVTLDVQYTPPRRDGSARRLRLVGTTTVSRREFGITHQSLVGRPADEVRIKVTLEATPTS